MFPVSIAPLPWSARVCIMENIPICTQRCRLRMRPVYFPTTISPSPPSDGSAPQAPPWVLILGKQETLNGLADLHDNCLHCGFSSPIDRPLSGKHASTADFWSVIGICLSVVGVALALVSLWWRARATTSSACNFIFVAFFILNFFIRHSSSKICNMRFPPLVCFSDPKTLFRGLNLFFFSSPKFHHSSSFTHHHFRRGCWSPTYIRDMQTRNVRYRNVRCLYRSHAGVRETK